MTSSKRNAREVGAVSRAKKGKVTRYGIAEWFGRDIQTLTPDERRQFAELSLSQVAGSAAGPNPPCPFLSTLRPGTRCNKVGGVCTLRRFAPGSDGAGVPVADDKVVTVCPSRFTQPTPDGRSIFVWVAEKMLSISDPVIVRETPFLRKVSDVPSEASEEMRKEAEEEEKKAGRIDWILANPASLSSSDLDWCAIETQALYFSGNKMRLEFDAYASEPDNIRFPAGKRRPDYRSSGPKRLWPQLDVKVPVLRAWGKKVAVLVDSYFFANMNTLIDPSSRRAKDDRERLDNAEVVWFIVDFDERLRMVPANVIYSSLDSSRNALNATEPLGRGDFTNNLKRVIERAPKNKVFRVSGSVTPS